jgi:hypothetical protein
MFDPLPTYTVRVHRLDPSLAELHIQFHDLPAGIEVQGRVMGPRCPGVTTVEVAYRLRPMPAADTWQVLIPEPVFWSAERPSVYEGPVEFRRDGKVVGSLTMSIGIKA